MKTGIIYIIKNDINSKVYIGQTTTSLETRFYQHCKKSTLANRHYKLYNAIRKYGKEHFFIKEIERNIPLNELNEREIYYIEKNNSFVNGYNSTKGGDGRTINKKYDEFQIVKDYKSGKSCNEIGKSFNVSYATISRVLKKLNVKTRHDGNKYESFGETFVELWNKGIKIKELAKKYNVDEKTIRRAVVHYGLKKRHKRTAN